MMNEKILEHLRDEMIREITKGKSIVNIEKHLKNYLRQLDAVKLTKKYHCSLDEAIDTIDALKKSDEINRIITMLG